MSSRFRATGPEDAGAIAQFLRQTFGMHVDNPTIDAAHMHWKYWCDHPDWEGSRGFVMERGADIIAHGSVIPLPCLWQDRRWNIVHLIDWAARADSTGAGMSLMKRVAQMVDGIFAAGGSDMTQKILPALGFKESGKATLFARPVRPLKRLLAESNWSWKSAARFGRNVLWSMKAPSSHIAGWSARRILAADLGNARFPLPHPTPQVSAVFERTVPAMAYFLDCPTTPAEFYIVEKQGSVRGYFVLTLARAQCRIVDAWLDSGGPEDWSVLYQLATMRGGEHSGIAEIATVATTEVAAQALYQTGFHPRGTDTLRFLLRGGAVPPPDIRYQLMDGDGAYRYDERQFWS